MREALNNILEVTGDENPFKDLTDKQKKELDQQVKDFEEAQERQRRILKDSLQLQQDIRSEFTASVIDGINSIFDAQIQRYQNEIDANNEYFESLLENQELSDEQREALELRREEREKQIRERQREAEKRAFLFNQGLALAEIAINLAKTISAVTLNAQLLGPLLAPGYLATNVALAIGTAAAQTAAVLSQQLPQFAEGKNFNDNYEGLGIWGERKRELKISKDGTVELSPKRIGNHLTYVKKDDIIIPDANRYLKGVSDMDLTSDLQRHVLLANISHQNYLANSLESTKNSNDLVVSKLDTLNSTLERKKMRVVFNQNMKEAGREIAKGLKFQQRKNNTL